MSALRAQPGGAGREPEGPLFCLTTLLSTVDSLGISDELKDKLEDVLIPEQQFTLGRMLGKGVWGCMGISRSGVCLSFLPALWGCGFGAAPVNRVRL